MRTRVGDSETAALGAATGHVTSEGEMLALERRAVQRAESPTGGRGDPTSTMLWSPIKHIGCKRPLEVAEEELSEEEEGSDGEEVEAVPKTERLASAATVYQGPEQETEAQQ